MSQILRYEAGSIVPNVLMTDMENGIERNRCARFCLVGNMLPGERNDSVRFGEAVRGLAELPKFLDVLIRELASDNEASQRLALPRVSGFGPFEDFMQDRHHHLRHSNASRAFALGLSLPIIGDLLSHSIVSTKACHDHLQRDASVRAFDGFLRIRGEGRGSDASEDVDFHLPQMT